MLDAARFRRRLWKTKVQISLGGPCLAVPELRTPSRPAPDLAPIEELDRNILNLHTRINAATYELLVLVREFDERAGWLKWGLQNCAEWLAWRCERSMMTITVELPLGAGELVEKALDKARDEEVLAVPDLVDTSWAKRQADAFVTMAGDYLSGNKSKGSTNDNYLVTIHVEQSALAGGEGRSALPIESVKRLCCDSKAVVITEDRLASL